METKLKNITTTYSKFSANQVLTESQLNTFLDYFEDQNRLSRLGLSGIGIVCGFEMIPQFNDAKTSIKDITITQGAGVTTDGDLVQFFDLVEKGFSQKTFSYFKRFEDDKANYPRFLNSQSKQFNLWELHSEADSSHTSLENFEDIQNMTVLLYLEQHTQEDQLCNKLTCDTQGVAQINNLRVLLIRHQDLKVIASKDAVFLNHDWSGIYEKLPVVAARRVVLGEENTQTFSALKEQFNSVVKDISIREDLISGYELLCSKFQKSPITSRINTLFNFGSLAVPVDFQYRYDALKDLIDTYNEIKELLLHLNVNCCPDIGAFPKHIMLGKLEQTPLTYPILRHRFYKSTIIGNENENLQRVRLLMERSKAIVTNYIGVEKSEGIYITPSNNYTFLSDKAVPFYYNVSSDFLRKWDFNKTKNYRENQNLSYHKDNLSKALSIQNPLLYSIDKSDFYRIEGHQGKIYKEALKELLKLKKDNGLNFDVKALSINVTKQQININNYECEFEDLKMLLDAWKAEQSCILSEVSKTFSAFKLTAPKVNSEIDKIEANGAVEVAIGSLPDKEVLDRIEALSSGMNSDTYKEYKTVATFDKYDIVTENIVKKSLTKEKDSLGLLVENVLEKNETGNASEILVELQAETARIKDTAVWKEEPDLGDFILSDVTETLVHVYVLDTKIPVHIQDIDTAVLMDYKLTIEQLCKKVKDLQAKYASTSLALATKQILGLLINQLSIVCCSVKKLETLLAEIEKRKKNILEKLQLSEFAKQHPGLEHKAGVVPGGTFVLVHVGENVTDDKTLKDSVINLVFHKQPIEGKKEVEYENEIMNLEEDKEVYKRTAKKKENEYDDRVSYKNGGIIKLWNQHVSTEFIFVKKGVTDFEKINFQGEDIVEVGETLAETVMNFTKFLNKIWKKSGVSKIISAGEEVMFDDKLGSVGMTIRIKDYLVPREEYFFQIYNPSILSKGNKKIFFDENEIISENIAVKNTVIADFSLPYMCCSDCTSVNFIIPKEPVFLSLPEKSICLKEDKEILPLQFTVRPLDGVVKAILPKGIDTGIFKDEEENVYKIDVTKIDKSVLGKSIKFTVNDEPTDCELVVYPILDLSVTIEEPIEYDKEKNLARVTYILNWKDFDSIDTTFFNSIKYQWDFKGDGTKVERTPVNNKVVENYSLPISEVSNEIQPTLTILLGTCQKTIPITPIIFDRSTPSELAIQPHYCLNFKTEKKVRVKFSNVKGVISIVDKNIEGVTIEGEELVINVALFKAFNQVITFLEDGQITNARITIREVKQISILESTASRFVWKNGQLFYEGAFEIILPDDVNPSTLSYQWKTEDITSKLEFFKPLLRIKEGTKNIFTIQLTVTDNNGCLVITEMIRNIPFPDFTITLPKIVYCLNDKHAHKISITPNYEGMELFGKGVQFNEAANEGEGQWEFVAANSGLTAPGLIPIGIVGAFASRDIDVIVKPKADFTYNLDKEKQVLLLTNTSEDGEEYVWTINGKEIKAQTEKETIKEELSNFEGDIIEVSLTVKSKCGDSMKFESVDIKSLKEESCEKGIERILVLENNKLTEKDKEIKSENLDVKELTNTIITPTTFLYTTVLGDAFSYLNGSNNESLEKLFLTLLGDTSTFLKKDVSNEILKKYYTAQVKLFIGILHCQDIKILEENEESIADAVKNILEAIHLNLNDFKKNNITIDILEKESSLKAFLEKCEKEITSKLVSNFIKNNLITLL